MVAEDDGLFRCEECGMRYRDRSTAEKCEDYCQTHDACSTDIAAESVDSGTGQH